MNMRKSDQTIAFLHELIRPLFFISLIALGVTATAWLSAPPAVRSEESDQRFSTTRAIEHLRVIAREPHPTGSPENARVRDYLVSQLREMGLEVRVQRELAASDPRGGEADAAWIENVVGVLPGANPGEALLLMSHYDSVPWAPGAADAGAGVVSVLESVRAASAMDRASRKRDLIVLLSDGEELGLFGARAFFDRDPLAKGIGTVLNFESRGSRGPALMFQTGPHNADMIRILARGPMPVANSYAQEIYKRMPNDTDFTVSLAKSHQGMNFAFVDGHFDYHSPTDTVENLSPETLQHLGDQAISATLELLSSASSTERGGDLHYMNFTAQAFFYYPPWVDIAGLLLATALILGGLYRAKRQQSLSIWTMTRATAGSIALLGCAAGVVMSLAGFLRIDFWPGAMLRALAAQQTSWFIAWCLIGAGTAVATLSLASSRGLRWWAAFLLATLALLPALRGGNILIPGPILAFLAWVLLRSPTGGAAMVWAGRMLGLILAWILMILMPGAANLMVWPMLGVAAVAVLTTAPSDGESRAARMVLPTVFAATVVVAASVMLGDFARNLDLALGATLPIVGVVPLLVLIALSMNAWLERRAYLIGLGMTVAGLCLALTLLLKHPFDARHPQPSGVFVLQDRVSQVDCLASIDVNIDDWQRKAMGDRTKVIESNLYAPEVWRETRCAPLNDDASRSPLGPIVLSMIAVAPGKKAGAKTIEMRLRAAGGRDRLDLYLPASVDLRSVRLDGLTLPTPERSGFEAWPRRIRAYALPDKDITLTLEVGSGDLPDALLAVSLEYGLPPTMKLPPRPPSSMGQTHHYSNARVTAQRLSLTMSRPSVALSPQRTASGKEL